MPWICNRPCIRDGARASHREGLQCRPHFFRPLGQYVRESRADFGRPSASPIWARVRFDVRSDESPANCSDETEHCPQRVPFASLASRELHSPKRCGWKHKASEAGSFSSSQTHRFDCGGGDGHGQRESFWWTVVAGFFIESCYFVVRVLLCCGSFQCG